ncbi:MAG: methyltransferase domain-containing protein [Planctomycetes bacterium]|nr:methyltransferase domain-containing protein [Planctomycetota bacterium]
MRLYRDLAAWWPLVSSPSSYAEEAAIAAEAMVGGARGPVRRVLELGCGGGNNASHLKARFEMTLTDLSPGMLDVSRALNPECEHAPGDMRTLRLGRTFDAVFVHDAVMYLTRERDLRATVATAFAHLRPGGVALFVPDDVKETWKPSTSHGGHDGEGRALRYLVWHYDPDASDTTIVAAYAFLLREGARTRAAHDRHTLGLFPRATWVRAFEDAGFHLTTSPYLHSSFPPGAGRELWLGVKP